jgi:hypothetical protein
MKGISGSKRDVGQGDEEFLCLTMCVPGQFKAPVGTVSKAFDDGLLDAPNHLSRQNPLPATAAQRRDDFGDRQVGHEHIVPTFHDLVELCAARLGPVKFEQGAAVAVEWPGQSNPVRSVLLTQPGW